MIALDANDRLLQGVMVSNGTGREKGYVNGPLVDFRVAEVGPDFTLDLDGADVLLVPNGCDSIALHKVRGSIRAFLDRGGTLICCDGWVTPWVPGNEWVMDNQYRTIDVRYTSRSDKQGVLDGVDIDALTFRDGISGWWACGYIKPAEGAEIVLEDSWGRAVVVVDDASTLGTIVMTASGPVGPWGGYADDSPSDVAINRLYRNFVKVAQDRKRN